MEKNNLEEVRILYRKTSINLLILVLPMYTMVVLSIDDLFRLTSQYETLKPAAAVVLLIGLGKIIGVSLSVNGQILIYSKYYRINLVGIFILAISNIILNYILIPRNGIVGAAQASLIAVTAYNLFHSIFLWIKLGMQPYTWRTAVALLLALASGAIAWIIPDFDIPLLDIVQNSILVLMFYVPVIIKLHLSEEINRMFRSFVTKVSIPFR
jgi:O-antigen/teichoic acid export membrane protein